MYNNPMPSKELLRIAVVLAASAMLALVSANCGSSGGDTGTNDTTPTTATNTGVTGTMTGTSSSTGTSSVSSTSTGSATATSTGTSSGTGTATGTSTGTATSTGSTLAEVIGEHHFGTVTATVRTPGDLDFKGETTELTSGGYMRFDLSSLAQGHTVSSAALQFYVKEKTPTCWVWVIHIPLDPASAPVGDVFTAIENHVTKLFYYFQIEDTGWNFKNLTSTARMKINEALANADPADRWIAMTLGFE